MRHSSAKRKRRPEEGSCLPLLRATLALPSPCRLQPHPRGRTAGIRGMSRT